MSEEVLTWWVNESAVGYSPLIINDDRQKFGQMNAENHPDIIFFLATHEEVYGEADERWDEVFGYVKTEYDIDNDDYRVVFHLEHNGYFTGYYVDTDVLNDTDSNRAYYKAVCNQMIKDLEKVDE